MPNSQDPTLFSAAAARRITAATSRSELLPFDQRTKRRRRYPIGGWALVKNATSASSIGGISGSTPGTGTATIDDFSPATGNLTARSGTVTVRNRFTATIASGKGLVIAMVDGAWFILSVNC